MHTEPKQHVHTVHWGWGTHLQLGEGLKVVIKQAEVHLYIWQSFCTTGERGKAPWPRAWFQCLAMWHGHTRTLLSSPIEYNYILHSNLHNPKSRWTMCFCDNLQIKPSVTREFTLLPCFTTSPLITYETLLPGRTMKTSHTCTQLQTQPCQPIATTHYYMYSIVLCCTQHPHLQCCFQNGEETAAVP